MDVGCWRTVRNTTWYVIGFLIMNDLTARVQVESLGAHFGHDQDRELLPVGRVRDQGSLLALVSSEHGIVLGHGVDRTANVLDLEAQTGQQGTLLGPRLPASTRSSSPERPRTSERVLHPLRPNRKRQASAVHTRETQRGTGC